MKGGGDSENERERNRGREEGERWRHKVTSKTVCNKETYITCTQGDGGEPGKEQNTHTVHNTMQGSATHINTP